MLTGKGIRFNFSVGKSYLIIMTHSPFTKLMYSSLTFCILLHALPIERIRRFLKLSGFWILIFLLCNATIQTINFHVSVLC